MKVLIFVFALFVSINSKAQKKILHYDETTSFDHKTRTVSFNFFKTLESKLGITVTQDSDGSEFTMAKMMEYDVVIFSNTSGNTGLSASQQEALEWFIDTKGGGLIGIHAASDTYRHSSANGGKTGSWDWYAEMLGGSVQTSPNHTSSSHVNTMTETTMTPATENIDFPWEKEEEYYYWEKGYLNDDIVEVLQVGDTGGSTWDDPRPMAWQTTNDAGSRIFYTALGHKTENFSGPSFPQFRQLIEDATVWALDAASTVPVELNEFKVIDKKNSVYLKWSTLAEINSQLFEVQRSVDRRKWDVIGKVIAAGNSQGKKDYNFLDSKPLSLASYYRLKQIDYNGEFMFSDVVQIRRRGNIDLEINPNPTNGIATISLHEKVQYLKLTVLDQNGQQLRNFKFSDSAKATLNIQDLPKGLYFIDIEADKIRVVTKIIKSE